MDRLTAMRTLARVIETGSFSGAARQLRVGQPSVSKLIGQLEKELGVRLLSRTTRSLVPTDAGQRFYERAIRAIEEADEAEVAARDAATGLSGRLRVSMAVTFGRLHVVPLLPEFLDRHPALEIDLVMGDNATDLIEEGIDVALRLGPQPDSAVAGRIIASGRRTVVAAPSYLAANFAPMEPHDLDKLQGIVLSLARGPTTWTFERDGELVRVTPNGRVRVTAAEGLRAAVLAGLGYAIGSDWGFARDIENGRVVEVLRDWSLPPADLWALFPAGRQPSARTRAFVDFIAARMRANPSHA
jgi:DNA-binding transcriptional LysR family regulator